MKQMLASLAASLAILFARLITAVRGEWHGCEPVPVQRIRLQRQESPQERQLEALLRDPIKLQSLRNMPKMAPPPPAEE